MELDEHPFVGGFNDEKRSQLLSGATIHEFPPRTVIFEKDSISDSVYLVLEGEVAFTHQWSDENPEQHIISTAPEGGFFGEIGVITDHPRSLAAVAHTQVKVAKISKELFLSLVQVSAKSSAVEQLLHSVINHLHHTTDQFVQDMVEKEKMGLVGTMVNGLMHDFRNPLNTISMSAQVMASEHTDDMTQDLCVNIDGQIKYITEMAQDIEDFSRGESHLRIESINIKQLVEEFKKSNTGLFDSRDIDFKLDLGDIVIDADKTKLLRVIQNLIKNALESFDDTPASERPDKYIEIKAQDLGDKIGLVVRDNGGGIPEKIKQDIYKPFVSGGKKEGSGLGMAIVKSNVDAHKGRISFESHAAEGTTFTVILPKVQEKQAEILG